MSPLFHPNRLLALLVLAALCLASCGRTNAPPDPADQPAELLWITLDVGSQVEQLLGDSYRESHPHITFQRQSLNQSQDYFTATPAPDVLMSFANRSYRLASRANQLADLSEVWAAAALEESLLPNIQLLVTDRESGQPRMLPIAFSWAAIYYNKAVFEEYNLQTPQTWNEFMEICAILQSNGETPLAMAGSESTAYTLWFDYLNLRLNGAQFHRDLLEGREPFDDPRVSTVLQTWRSLFDQGYVVARPEFMDAGAAIGALVRNSAALLGSEQAAMVLMDTTTLSGTPPEFRAELDFFRFPILDPAIPLAESVDVIGYVIPTNASHGPQAQDFLTYLGSPVAQTLIAREAAVINVVFAPVRANLEADAIGAEMSRAIGLVQASTEVVPFSYQQMPPTLWTAFNRAYRQLLTNKQDIQSFMDTMEAARQQAREAGEVD